MKLLSLTPSFSSAQDGPSFVLTLQNDTSQPLRIIDLLGISSLLLDGKQYKNQIIKFAGHDSVAPGANYSLEISPETYLYQGEKQSYSPVLKRWRWKTGLRSGKHTLAVRVGTAQIGPIEFYWDDTVPLLYR